MSTKLIIQVDLSRLGDMDTSVTPLTPVKLQSGSLNVGEYRAAESEYEDTVCPVNDVLSEMGVPLYSKSTVRLRVTVVPQEHGAGVTHRIICTSFCKFLYEVLVVCTRGRKQKESRVCS